ncbi:metallophosphoesterase [Endothiovibrio diazotrophicus]
MTVELVQRFTRNDTGRDFVVGDLHGEFSRLEERLGELAFDTGRDRLFSVGDLVNRGPYSERVVEWLDRPWFHPVMGNHEEMLLVSHLKGIDRNGGSEMEAYRWWIDGSLELREACASRMAKLPVAIEVETAEGPVGVIHAAVADGLDWEGFLQRVAAGDERTCREALWGFSSCLPVAGLRWLFCGHAIVPAPTRIGNLRFIDTGAYEGGPLTVASIV